MTEEEKKAIEKLSSKQNETTWVDTIRQIKREEITDAVITRQKYITTILNLIEKQQKEIEELKEKNASLQKEIKLMKSCDLAKVIKKQEKEIEALEIIHNTYKEMIEENDYISKDKVRKHLKKFEEIEKEFIFIDNKSTAREINKALIEFSKRLLEE